MLDAETRALLRAIHEETCANLPNDETRIKSHVALRILQAASQGPASVDDLRRIGRAALLEAD
jgi:hypothetical protein